MDEYIHGNCRQPELAPGEVLLWRGKPKRGAFYVSTILTCLLLLCWVAVWYVLLASMRGMELLPLTLDSVYEVFFLQDRVPVYFIIIIVFGPLVLGLVSILRVSSNWKKTNYYATNRRIIWQQGKSEHILNYKNIEQFTLRRGFVDKLFQTSSLRTRTSYFRSGPSRTQVTQYRPMTNLEDAELAYEIIHSAMEKAKKDQSA